MGTERQLATKSPIWPNCFRFCRTKRGRELIRYFGQVEGIDVYYVPGKHGKEMLFRADAQGDNPGEAFDRLCGLVSQLADKPEALRSLGLDKGQFQFRVRP